MKHLLLFIICSCVNSSNAQTKENAISSPQADTPISTKDSIPKPQRIRLNEPILKDVKCEKDCIIYFKLMVDDLGNVVSTQVLSKTTTKDQDLISRVNDAVKTIKYIAIPGEPLTAFYYTIKIHGVRD